MSLSVKGVIRSTFNTLVPSTFYQRKFNVGDILVPQGIETGTPVDLPRFEGDTFIHVLGGFTVQIAGFSRGEYSGNEPQAEFHHTRLGYPHYEVKILEEGGAFSNYSRRELPKGSKIHIDAQIFDARFEAIPKTQGVLA